MDGDGWGGGMGGPSQIMMSTKYNEFNVSLK